MIEIHLKLHYEVITSLLCGEAAAVTIEEEDVRIVLQASDEAIKKFLDNTQKVVLAMADTGPSAH